MMKTEKNRGLLSIGKMAKVNRVTIATLRLYDEMGLLRPSYIDTETGYRYYDIRQTSRLDFIRYMRELGLSLSDMHEAVDRTIQSIERFRKSPESGTISLEFIDRRYILYTPCVSNFYETGIVAYEATIQELRTHLIERNLPQILSYSMGTSVRQQDFEEERFIPDQVFIFGDRQLQEYGDNTRILDSGMYACIYLDNFDDEIKCAKALLEYCRENSYTIAGDYICEELTEFNIFDTRQRNMFLRLQIPVTFQKKT